MSGEAAKTRYKIEPLGPAHGRDEFSCGVPALDRYLQNQAAQDMRKKVAAVFVATADGVGIAGFYTLSAHSLTLGELPESVARKLPRYPNVPATLLGRLAVAQESRGRGVGELLLLDALRRALRNTREVASVAVVVDAKDETAREFYIRYGFVPLPTQPNRLFYLMRTIKQLFPPGAL